jgi:hypothetical protein
VRFTVMSSSPAGGSRSRVRALLFGVIALVSAFALVSFASGAADTLKGGTAQLKLKQKKLKFKSAKPKLTITSGSVDPTNMSGTATVTGKTTAKGKKGKAKLQFTALNLTGGGAGSLDAKVGSKKVAKCMTFTKGALARNGFDGVLANAKLALSKKCAKQIKKKTGAGKKGAVGNVVTVDTVPSTVTLTGGSATLVFDNTALQHLSAHGLLPNGAGPGQTGNGVSAIAPATLDVPTHTFTFPVTGGSMAPDGSTGQVKLAGGIDLKKVNTSCLTGGGVVSGQPTCAQVGPGTAAPPDHVVYPAQGTSGSWVAGPASTCPGGPAPSGTAPCNGPGGTWGPTACNDNNSEIAITDLVFDAASKVVTASATITVPIAPSNNQTLANAPLSTITSFSGSLNPATKSGSFNAALVNTLAGAGAENSVFGSSATPTAQGGFNGGPYSGCNAAANDFAPNAANGTADPIGQATLGVNAQ